MTKRTFWWNCKYMQSYLGVAICTKHNNYNCLKSKCEELEPKKMSNLITVKKGFQTIGTYVCNNYGRENNRCNIDREECSPENMKYCFKHYPEFFEEIG